MPVEVARNPPAPRVQSDALRPLQLFELLHVFTLKSATI
ncbi:hypothetical protein SF83666_c37540 [Sinorhizobium fredii CCBAU 83666]|nr:hypothetical protein SF83666_c37540 [Sinorhizobium fredii CCBAU 83666]